MAASCFYLQDQRQVFRYLQEFRDRLSEDTLRHLASRSAPPKSRSRFKNRRSPISGWAGTFDRNCQLLSPVAPVVLIKSLVRRHFTQRIPEIAYANTSRLTPQWEESIHAALLSIEKKPSAAWTN